MQACFEDDFKTLKNGFEKQSTKFSHLKDIASLKQIMLVFSKLSP